MTRFSKLVLPAMAALLIAAPYAVQAQGQQDPLALYKAIGAKPEQLQQITAIHKEFEGLAKSSQQKLEGIQKRMHDISLQPLPNEKDALATNDQLNQVIVDVNTARLKMMIKIRKVLTPDQRQKVVDEVKKREAAGPQMR